MKQQLDLDGITLTKDANGTLTVMHHKTRTATTISEASLVRWLMRQLRALF